MVSTIINHRPNWIWIRFLWSLQWAGDCPNLKAWLWLWHSKSAQAEMSRLLWKNGDISSSGVMKQCGRLFSWGKSVCWKFIGKRKTAYFASWNNFHLIRFLWFFNHTHTKPRQTAVWLQSHTAVIQLVIQFYYFRLHWFELSFLMRVGNILTMRKALCYME